MCYGKLHNIRHCGSLLYIVRCLLLKYWLIFSRLLKVFDEPLGPVYTGLDKFGTGPLRDLIGSVPKRLHESGPKLFQIARPFTWDRIVHQIAKITAVLLERHLVVEEESPSKSRNIEE